MISLGLYDEHYSPVKNLKEEKSLNRGQYLRVQGGFDFSLMEGLNFDLRFQTEMGNYRSQKNFSKDSYTVRNMVNDAAQYDHETKTITYNVPRGGQLSEERGDSHSWTLRPQLRFDRDFGKQHHCPFGFRI